MIFLRNYSLSNAYLSALLTALISLAGLSAGAATIDKVKGKAVIITMDSDAFNVGESLFIIDTTGKKRGLISINKIKGTKALGKVSKGKAQKGWEVQRKKASEQSSKSGRTTRSAIGFTAGTSMDNMSLKFDSGETVAITGSGINARLIFDLNPSLDWGFRFGFGMEQFAAEGQSAAANCSGLTDCYLRLNYTAIDFGFRKFYGKVWLGLGFSYYIHGGGETTAVASESIKDVSVGIGEVGYSLTIGKRSSIPLAFGIIIMPPSPTVTTTIMFLKSGFVYSL
jgi:hypothetical protein